MGLFDAIGSLFGGGGGQSGTGINPAQQANIQQGANVGQANIAYGQNQGALQQQNALLAALQGQNGLQNQNQVYGQLQGIASGAVNPAQAQFNQNTAANIASQNALMAGQRGASSNVGLIARQAAMQGANTQQQAAGQAASQQAQNQINAIGAAGNLATTQAGQQIGQVNANTAAQQSEQANLLNALGQYNSSNVSSQGSVNAANAGLANTQLQGQQGAIGGLMNTAGSVIGMAGGLFKADGGMVGMSGGGSVGPQSEFGQFLAGVQSPGAAQVASPSFTSDAAGAAALSSGVQGGLSNATSGLLPKKKDGGSGGGDNSGAGAVPAMGSGMPQSRGGMVDVVVSPGEKIVPPREVQKCAQGGKPQMRTVPGKAEVAGDSIENDRVPAKLPAGTIVVKRTRANNDPEGFIKEVLSKRKAGK